jgi:hypothetical protein
MQNERPARQAAAPETGSRIYSSRFPFGTSAQDDILAVFAEKGDQVITALLENWKRISSRGSGAKNEVGYTPGYARNVGAQDGAVAPPGCDCPSSAGLSRED